MRGLVERIAALGRLRAPAEAVGFIVGDKVIELVNRSKRPHDSFEIWPQDVGIAMHNNELRPEIWQDPTNITLWHTHPSGGVGPSRLDMQHRLRAINHMVVTLKEDEVIPSWY